MDAGLFREELEKIKLDYADPERRRTESLRALQRHLKLDEDLLDFTDADRRVLYDCLYATRLLVDCKNATLRVKRAAWQEIEARLLLPPE